MHTQQSKRQQMLKNLVSGNPRVRVCTKFICEKAIKSLKKLTLGNIKAPSDMDMHSHHNTKYAKMDYHHCCAHRMD